MGFFDPETASVRQTEMYVEGFKAKLKKDTSYKGLWIVSFTLNFSMEGRWSFVSGE